MQEVIEFIGRVDANGHKELTGGTIAGPGFDGESLPRLQRGKSFNIEQLISAKANRAVCFAWHELKREYPHPHEVGTVDALETFGDDRTNSQKQCPLGGPVPRRSGPVFLAGNDDERDSFFAVAHGSIVDGHLLAHFAA